MNPQWIKSVCENNIGIIRTARELWPHIKPAGRAAVIERIRQSQIEKHFYQTGTWLERDELSERRAWPRRDNQEAI